MRDMPMCHDLELIPTLIRSFLVLGWHMMTVFSRKMPPTKRNSCCTSLCSQSWPCVTSITSHFPQAGQKPKSVLQHVQGLVDHLSVAWGSWSVFMRLCFTSFLFLCHTASLRVPVCSFLSSLFFVDTLGLINWLIIVDKRLTWESSS